MRIPQPGESFGGRYRIEAKLGEGAFGAVFLATELQTQRPVALKVLKPTRSGYDPQTRARFEREGEVIAGLQSPFIVTLLDRGTSEDGVLFLVFERIRGEDLSALLERRGQLQTDEVVHILSQVLEALRDAHAAGLLHRDLKPQNVRIFRYGDDPLRVKVLDFGLARGSDDGHPSITATGEVIGTPRYMSPEQLSGRPLTPASDIYSLGLVAIELLQGRDALRGNQLGAQIDRVVPGYEFDFHAVEPALAAVLRKMTTLDPAQRYPSAAAALSALHHLSEARNVSVARPVRPTAAPRSRRTAAIVGLGLAAVAAYGAAVYFGAQSRPSVDPGPHPNTTSDAKPVAKSAAPAPTVVPDLDVPPAPHEEAAPSSIGCGAKPPFTGLSRLSAAPGLGSTLTYIPTGYVPDQRHPVVVYIHPIGRLPDVAFPELGIEELAEKENFVVLMPEDGNYPWQDPAAGADQVIQVISEADRLLCIDPERVYVLGQGQGGHVANILACLDVAAAIATHGYRPDLGYQFCEGAPPIPFMLLIPKKSRHNPFDGGTSCTFAQRLSAKELEDMWRHRNGCTDEKQTRFDHAGSECFSYDCETPLRVCHLNGGHDWPGATPRKRLYDMMSCDGPPTDFPMLAEKVWQFFKSAERNDRGHSRN